MSYIIAEDLMKSFGAGAAAVHAVSSMSFRIAPGEFVAIMGESGAGKSTLLGMLGAMNAPTSGRLQVDGIDIYRLNQASWPISGANTWDLSSRAFTWCPTCR